MKNCYKIFNIILLSILIILYICSITYESKFLNDSNNIKNVTRDLLIFDMIITSFMIMMNVYLGYSSLYFYSEVQIIIYLIIIVIFFISKGVFLLILVIMEKLKFKYSYINMVAYFIFSQIIILFINFIFGLFYRFAALKELNESPLNRIDEFITEDMYKNILTQSLNPDDKDLKKDFEKQFEQRKTERNSSSSEN